MNVILNEVIAVRMPTSLKEKLIYFAQQEEVRPSIVIRQAVVAYLKKEMPELFDRRPTSWGASI